LPKSHKLHKAEEFSSIIRFKCLASSEFLQVFAKPNNLTCARLGVIIAGRVERLATKRNRIKRLLRELFRMQQKDFVGFDFVIRLRHPVGNSNSFLVADEAKVLMIRARQCCE